MAAELDAAGLLNAYLSLSSSRKSVRPFFLSVEVAYRLSKQSM